MSVLKYNEGWVAYWSNLSLSDNPYDETNGLDSYWWIEGFEDAEYEHYLGETDEG